MPSTVSLIVDNKVVSAVNEERFTRKKNDETFPKNSIDYCLKNSKIKPNELDAVAYSSFISPVDNHLINLSGWTVQDYLKEQKIRWKPFLVDKTDVKAKRAVLNYKMIKKLENYFLLEIILETGRHHQIRCQLSHIGCPIKGDVKYGARRPNKDRSICLHSNKIEFIHPVTKKELTITAQPPNSNIWLL